MKTMSMFATKEDMLKSILSTMDIPENRRDITDFGNLKWLTNNLQFKNRENEDYGKAISIIKDLYVSAYMIDIAGGRKAQVVNIKEEKRKMKTYFVESNNVGELQTALGRMIEYAKFLETESGRNTATFGGVPYSDEIIGDSHIKVRVEEM